MSTVIEPAAIVSVEHVRCERWTRLGAMFGVFPVLASARPLDDGWEARVEAHTLAGAIVGVGVAQCLRSEKTSTGADFALLSTARARAATRALRQPLKKWVSNGCVGEFEAVSL